MPWLRRGKAWDVAAILIVTALAIMSLMPLYWMVSTAFTQPTLVVKMPPDLIPSRPTLHNFRDLFTRRLLGRWTLNSAIVAVSVTVAQLFVASLAGYAFAKKEFIGRNLLFWLYIGSMMVPGQVTLIPRYILMARMHLTNTYAGLILPSVAAPLGVFLMKQFMQTIPGEIIDAGRIDGASEFGVFTRLIVPLSKPAMAVLGIFTFVGEWNDFLWPLVITNSSEMRTLQVGLAMLQEEVPMAFGTLMAGATYAAIPITLVFLLFQRYFLKGLTVGALKG
ncbi:MAG: carbohydrate ABC transporter permease [Bacillota bacterium]|jgi:multiple sugar transport system permease protein|nr:carbohydrate ABC transporter permease [Bacillota bacterium]